jgi:secreted trypsin-like serine protease
MYMQKWLYSIRADLTSSMIFATLAFVASSADIVCAQQTPPVLERLRAAESFAAKLALPGSPEFEEYRQKALEIAISPPPTARARSLSLGVQRSRPTVDSDQRFQSNALAMARQRASIARPRVFGGTLVVANAYPDAVSVQGAGTLCSGTLIAPNVVLTAGHCHCGNANQLVTFGVDLQKPDQTFKVARSVPMGTCAADGSMDGGRDVALLFLETSSSVKPRVIAGANLMASIGDVTAVGFGLTERETSGIKILVDLPVASPTCEGNVEGKPDDSYYGCVKSQEMVAGMQNLKKDTCRGDSGGPIYAKTPIGELLVAATSRGVATAGAATCGDGGVYELLQGAILDWIKTTNHVDVTVAR